MIQWLHIRHGVALILFATLVNACGGNGESTVVDENRVPVFTARVERVDLSRIQSYSGSVEGIRQATVFARIPETVQSVFVREGDRVTKGDRLVALDETGSSSVIRQARAVADDARKTAEKYQRLFEQGAVSEIERDARRTQFDVAQADYEAARDQTLITAPMSGIVTDVYARTGRQLSMGEPLVLIAVVDTVRVLVDISVYESEDIQAGQSVTIRSALDTSLSATGWVDEVSGSANTDSRNVSVEVLAMNPDQNLKPGLFVEARIELERRIGTRGVPREALVYRKTGLGVFVVRDSIAHYTPVTVGIESNALVEILDGPNVGETVVTLGQSGLQDGSLVNPAVDAKAVAPEATPQ